MNTAKPKAKVFVGDNQAATFRWELRLDNGYVMDGYSKAKYQAEKFDKQALFQDCVARLLNNGYLDKTYQMLFYKRAFLHKSQDTFILEMRPSGFEVHDYLKLDVSTINFLRRIYDARKSGMGLDYKDQLPPRQSVRDYEKEAFAFSLERFPTEDKLVEYCRELVKTYEYKRVEAWWQKVKNAYAGTTQIIPAATVTYPATSQRQTPPMDPDPDNQQAAAAAKQAVNGLYGKFGSNR